MLSAWLRFRYRKWTHLRRETGAALAARASVLCITSRLAPASLLLSLSLSHCALFPLRSGLPFPRRTGCLSHRFLARFRAAAAAASPDGCLNRNGRFDCSPSFGSDHIHSLSCLLEPLTSSLALDYSDAPPVSQPRDAACLRTSYTRLSYTTCPPLETRLLDSPCAISGPVTAATLPFCCVSTPLLAITSRLHRGSTGTRHNACNRRTESPKVQFATLLHWPPNAPRPMSDLRLYIPR